MGGVSVLRFEPGRVGGARTRPVRLVRRGNGERGWVRTVGMGSGGRFRRWIRGEPAGGGRHSRGGGESLTRAKGRGRFICPKEFIADQGISRLISDGTFSNGHCGTATGVNVIWIQRLIMKRKERKSAQSQSHPCCEFEKKESRTVASCFPRRHTLVISARLLHPRLPATAE